MDELLHDSERLRVERLADSRKTLLRFIGTGMAPEGLALDGLALPREMNRADTGDVRAMRLGPGEWLAVGWACPSPEALPPSLFAVDMGDGLVSLDLRGPLCRALLAGATSLDLAAAAFAPGAAARTRLARASAIVECIGPSHVVLHVDRSISAYIAAWLVRHAPLVEAAG